jgi:tetratricopeptide (TPR) repeat protein
MRRPAALTAAPLLLVATLAGRPQQATPDDPLRQQYQAAQTFQLAGDLERAQAAYEREVLPRALRRLAALASAEGRQDEARQYLGAALGYQPANLDLTLDLIVVLLRARDVQAARPLARGASSAHPGDARALRLYGKVLLVAGENADARALLERSMALAAEFDTGLSLAYANLRTKRVTEARALFDEMIARNGSAEIRSLIGRAYFENDLLEPAAAQFAEALRLDPAHEPSRRLLDELRAGGRFDRDSTPAVILQEPPAPGAERGARIRQQLVEVIASSYFNLGVIHSRRQRAADAAEAMARARAWKPDLEGIDRAAGIALFYADRFAEAIAPLERHVAAFPADDAARKLLETSYLMAGRTRIASVAAAPPAAETAPLSDADRLAAELESGSTEEVERRLWALLAREPGNARALDVLGRLLLGGHRYVEAEAIFRRGTEVEPANPEAWLGRARALRGSRRTAEARTVLETALERIPGDAALEYEMARTLLAVGDPAAALQHLARVPPAARPVGSPGVEIGARVALGDVDQARILLAGAASTVDEETAVSLVTLLLQHGLAADARAFAEASLARGMTTAPLLVAGARARLAEGDRAGAEQWFEQALGADSTSVEALIGLGDLIAPRDPDRATDLFLTARTHGGASPSLLRALALSAAAALRFEEALDAARALTDLGPSDAEAINLLGTIQLQVGDWPAAEKTFGEMAALAPADPRAMLGAGIARYGQRRYADAEAALDRSLALDPALGEAHYQLALVARDDGRAAVAVARLERAVALLPRHQAAHVALGSLLIQAGEYERARHALERAVALGPSSPDPYYQLGLLYARLQEPERARQAMDEFRRRTAAGVTKPRP